MSLILHLGPSGSGKTSSLHRLIFTEAAGDFFNNYLLIVPEQYTLETQRAMVEESPTKGIMNIDVLSFMRLADRIIEDVGMKRPIILEDTGKGMIVKKVAMDKKDELGIYRGKVGRQGFIDEMKSVIAEFYQYGISPEDVNKIGELVADRAVLPSKLKDINVIYRGFREFIEDRFIMNEEILDVLVRASRDSKVLRGACVFFDGFTGFTVAQLDVISMLLRTCREVHISLTMDPKETELLPDEESLFYLSRKTMEKLMSLAADAGALVSTVKYSKTFRFASEELKALEAGIFRNAGADKIRAMGDVRLVSCETSGHELEYVLKSIKELRKQRGYKYSDFAVVTGDMSSVAKPAGRAFKRAGVPCFIDNKKNIVGTSLVELIRAVLEITGTDYSFESVFRYLKSGVGPIDNEAVDLLENYCLAKNIRGRSRWDREWVTLYRTKHRLSLEKLNECRQKVMAVLGPVTDELKNSDITVSERVVILKGLVEDLRIRERLEEQAEKLLLSEDEELRLLGEEAGQLYECVCKVFERIEALLGSEKLSLKEFAEILDTGFKEAKLGSTPRIPDSVLVGDIERSRLSNIRVLYFIGVNDGIIPKTGAEGGILSDSDRTLLLENSIELSPTKRQSIYLSQFYLYLNMTKPSDKLFVLSHRMSADGKPTHNSYLFKEINGLFDGLKLEEAVKESHLIGSYAPIDENISPETARKLYGEALKGSVTLLEKYANCAYSHFLQYGLKLEERPEYAVGNLEIGNIYHRAIELYFKGMKKKGMSWRQGSCMDEDRQELQREALDAAFDEYREVLSDTKRSEYSKVRIARIMDRTVGMLEKQISAGDFEPEYIEESFTHANRFMTLTGKIDRMDICGDVNDRYLRIVDYKSGTNTFELKKLWLGLSLQLAVYMKEGRRIANGKPAGMYYYNIDDPILEQKGEKTHEELINRRLRMVGPSNSEVNSLIRTDRGFMNEDEAGELTLGYDSPIVNVKTKKNKGKNDSTEFMQNADILSTVDFEVIGDFVDKRMLDEGERIMSGKIPVFPVKNGQDENSLACTYCGYRAVCGFDKELGCRVNDISRVKGSKIDFLNKIRDELKGTTDGQERVEH